MIQKLEAVRSVVVAGLTILVLSIATLVVVVEVARSWAPATVLEPIRAPKVLVEEGYTPEVLAARLFDAVTMVERRSQETRAAFKSVDPEDGTPGNGEKRAANAASKLTVNADVSSLDLKLPQSDLTLRTAIGIVKGWFGQTDHRIGGEILIQHAGEGRRYIARIRFNWAEGGFVDFATTPNASLNQVIDDAAEAVVTRVDPYLYAQFRYATASEEDHPLRVQEAIDNCLRRCDPVGKIKALNLRGALLIGSVLSRVRDRDTLFSIGASSSAQVRAEDAVRLYQRLIGETTTPQQILANVTPVYFIHVFTDPDGTLIPASHALAASIYSNFGTALWRIGRHADAIAMFRAALRSDGRNSVPLISWASGLTGQPELAVSLLERAVKIDANNNTAFRNLIAGLARLSRQEAQARSAIIKGGAADVSRALVLGIDQLVPDEERRFGRSRAVKRRLHLVYPELALQFLDRALELDPPNLAAFRRKADILKRTRRLEEAAAVLEVAIGRFPDLAELYLQLAAVRVDMKQWSKAIDAFDTAGELGLKESAERISGLASAYVALRQRGKAIETLAGWSLDFRLGDLLRDEGRFDEAQEAWRRAAGQMKTPTSAWDLGDRFASIDDLETAQEIWEDEIKAVEQRGQPVSDAYRRLGDRLIRLGEADSARKAWQQAVAKASNPGRRLESLEQHATTLARHGYVELALAVWREASRHSERSTRRAMQTAEALVRIGRNNEAAEVLGWLLHAVPPNDAQLFEVGDLYRQIGNIPEALKIWQVAAAKSDHEGWAKLSYADRLLSIGRDDEAAAQIGQAMRFVPHDGDAYLDVGDRLLRLGRPDYALQVFSAVADAAPQHYPDWLVGRSILIDRLVALGHAGKAVPLLRAAVRENPNEPLAHFELGADLIRSGNHDEGRHHLRRVGDLVAKSPRAMRAWATALQAKGDGVGAELFRRRADTHVPVDR